MRVATVIFATLALTPAIAAAEDKKTDAKDPDRIICERQKSTESRVATKRVCMTAAEWDERRREDRDAIEKGQRQARGPSGS
jgi:hypothetical protein